MPDSEFKLVNETFKSLLDREKKRGSANISDIERVVLLVWHASGIIENGGFHYFFECGLPVRETAEAYGRIGVDSVSSILRRVLELFPRNHIPDDYNERMEIVQCLYQDREDLMSRLESDFYDADAFMQRQLAGWIRVHKDLFPTTHPA
jgi:hypothetical protein